MADVQLMLMRVQAKLAVLEMQETFNQVFKALFDAIDEASPEECERVMVGIHDLVESILAFESEDSKK